MLFKLNNRTYSTFQTLGSYRDVQVYLAKDVKDNSQLYLINEICCPRLIRSCLDGLLTLRKEKNFSEFVEIFSLNSKLYLVFKYRSPYLILDYLNKYKLSFSERVKIMDNYLFQLSSYSHLHPAVVHSLTDLDNINVYSDGTVYFNFSLKPRYLREYTDRSQLFQQVASLFKILFPSELKSNRGKQLQVILEKCEKRIYKSAPEIIKDLQGIDTSTSWEKLKKYFQARRSRLAAIKNLVITFLMIVFFVIIYTRFIAPGPATTIEPAQPVTQIGEVTIIEEESDDRKKQ